ncbi:MAG: guanitoxin biosynthesis heme-dependent pre-guanitoxin N-hydroxylase GntA [Mycobacterium sp.]
MSATAVQTPVVTPTGPVDAATAAWNPLAADASARRWSSYLGVREGALLSLLHPESRPHPSESAVHELLCAMVQRVDYPCLGARSSFRRKLYRFGVYPDMGSAAIARALCHDLYEFANELHDPEIGFASFIATFLGPEITDERHFEGLLWDQLQQLHDVDRQFFVWDPDVSNDPDDSWFSFSIGGTAYYIVGLHPLASRLSRRFAHPSIVFNFHTQFSQLRSQGRLDSFKRAIRARDIALQGSINPTLTHGSGSQTRQYSGRAVEAEWRCPLHVGGG